MATKYRLYTLIIDKGAKAGKKRRGNMPKSYDASSVN